MAFAVAEAILKKLAPLAAEQAGLLWSFKSDFLKLKSTVSSIRAVLLDADEQSGMNHQVRDWLDELKQVLYDADDLLDDFSTEALLKQRRNDGNRCVNEVCLFFTRSNQLVSGLVMAHRLKAIRTKLDEIDENRRKFNLETRLQDPAAAAAIKHERQTDSFVPYGFVGREEDKKKIIAMLLSSTNDEQKIEVIPILGMGGLGKTALAQCIYNDKNVSTCFQLKIWICVSDNFDQALLVRKMLESITKRKVEDLDLDILKGELKKEMGNKRFLLVLDDVWDHGDYKGKWDSLMSFWLQVEAAGSKIIVTTRLGGVANYFATKGIKPHKLKGLSEQESWVLFEQIAFKGEVESGERFVYIGKEVMRRCMGVPLAIRVIAGALSSKSNIVDWVAIRDKQAMFDGDDERKILGTLKLSYDNLPSELKSCFVYCSLFPKDFDIDVKLLVQIWMGQGFINSSQSSSASFEVGVEYFKSLLSRFFFQEPKSDAWGNVKWCKMHDLMHDVALGIASEEIVALKALDSMEGRGNSDRLRHISFDFEEKPTETWKAPDALASATVLRTFLPINTPYYGIGGIEEQNCEMIFSNNTRLRVLSLHGAKLESVARSIHKLTHLRYLNLGHNLMEVLPGEITILVNLQVLILNYCENLEQLPRDIVKLTDLEFLSLVRCSSLKGLPLGIGRLTRLRELSLFVVSAPSDYSHGAVAARISELEHLDNLSEELEIRNLELVKDEAEAKAASLFRKQHLQALTLKWSLPRRVFAGRDVGVLKALEPHKNLKELKLNGYGGHSLPSWFSTTLQNLIRLTLSNLGRLKYIEDDAGQFLPRLKYLWIRNCPRLVSWRSTTEIEMPQFPSLSDLRIEKCPKLVRLPHISADIDTVYLNYVDRKLLDQFVASFPPPSSPSRIKNLTICEIRGLRILPQGLLPHLASLEYLWIWGCPNLMNLYPPATSQQQHLTSLQFSALSNLRRFYIFHLPGIKRLPEWLQHSSNLQVLSIHDCDGLKCLPKWLPKLTALDTLIVSGCHFLSARLKSRTAEDWPKVAHIRKIDIDGTKVQRDGNYMRVEEPADENQLQEQEASGGEEEEEEEEEQQQQQELFSEEEDVDDADNNDDCEEEEEDDDDDNDDEEEEGLSSCIPSPSFCLGILSMEADIQATVLFFRMTLMTYKHKTHVVDSDRRIISDVDVDFYINDDEIHVVDSNHLKEKKKKNNNNNNNNNYSVREMMMMTFFIIMMRARKREDKNDEDEAKEELPFGTPSPRMLSS
ncbi:unnamed protein product [Linum tenue]|uniref:Disease resistance protein RGA3 n=1 Tax=Linum tenue TaxID=586396 RepID=A0AAV0M664_9ROSI|nr:unnamed protein product [Linum tenue]